MASSIATRGLTRLAHLIVRYPKAFWIPQLVLFVLSVGYTITQLEFHTDRNALVSAEKEYHRNFLNYLADFESQDDLVTVVESGDREKNRQFVERLGARLAAEPDVFRSVFFKGDLALLGPKALLFLDDASIVDTMRDQIRSVRPMIEAFSQVNSLESLVRELNRQFREAPREANEETEGLVDALPALERILQQAESSLTRSGTPPSPGAETLFGAGAEADSQKYVTFSEGRLYLVTARPADVSKETEAIRRLREIVTEIQAEVPGVNVGVTGETILAQDEMRQSQLDSIKASVISLLLVLLIFSLCYQETGRPLKATACLLVGLGYTMGYTTLFVGHLNILTIAFFPMLIGLAIDFGVHLITRYEEELRKGATEPEAIEQSLVHSGQGVFTGCLTTAGAFYAMAFTEFKGVQEMGIITGGGMILSLLPMMTLLPVLLLRGKQNQMDHHPAPPLEDHRAHFERLWLARPKTALMVGAMLSLLALSQVPKVYFDYNLLNMQSADLPAVYYEKKLIDEAEKSVIFALVIADTVEEAAAFEEAIKALPSVASVDSMTRFLSADQSQLLDAIDRLKLELRDLNLPPPNEAPIAIEELGQSLTFLESYLSLAARTVAEQDPQSELPPQFTRIAQAAGALRNTLRSYPPERVQKQLGAFQTAFFNDMRNTFTALANQDTRAPLSVSDLPAELRGRFVGRTGQHLLQVYPKENIWERTHQETFIQELRDLGSQFPKPPIITGTPVQLYEYTSLLKKSYEDAAIYALIAISLLILIHFRSPVTLLLALLPVGMGWLWLLGIMGVSGIPFNPANIMTLPLVVGIGVTNGIHILNRYREEQNPNLLSKSTGKGVLVSGLTTMAGFGSLTLAHHQGIQSLGFVMTIGVFTCMIGGLTFLPCLLQLIYRKSS